MKKSITGFIIICSFLCCTVGYSGIYMGTAAGSDNYHASQPYQMQPYPSTNMPAPAVVNPATISAPAAATKKPSDQCFQKVIYGKGPLQPANCPPLQKTSGRPRNYKVHTGSVKANVEQMVAQSKWGRVVWNVPNDYRWIGNVTITATSIQDAVSQYLEPYPVQAVFYKKNHVVSIVPRRQA